MDQREIDPLMLGLALTPGELLGLAVAGGAFASLAGVLVYALIRGALRLLGIA